MTSPTVFVVDDDPSMRRSLCWLSESLGLHAEAYESAEAFQSHYDPNRPGCLVLDLRMPGMNGIELQAQLSKDGVNVPTVFVTGYGEVSTAVKAMQAGAVGFLEKPFSDHELLENLQRAIDLDAEQRRSAQSRARAVALFERLSRRERQVMRLMAAGRANKQIASELEISQKTVEVHRSHVMKKLQAQSIASVVRLATALEEVGVLKPMAAIPTEPSNQVAAETRSHATHV